jgi:group I intron endonuclease
MKHYVKPICGIYKITHRETGKAYVGLSTDILERWKSHSNFAQAKSRWQYIKRALHSHGIDNFIFEVLEECSEEMLNEREIFWIEHFNTKEPNGYNLTHGGGFGRLSFESEKKRRNSLKGRKFSEEHRRKIGEKSKVCNLGRNHTEETRRKMSKSSKGKKLSEDSIRKMSESKKNEKKVICEHCGKESNRGNYLRWHGERCKIYKEFNVPEKLGDTEEDTTLLPDIFRSAPCRNY